MQLKYCFIFALLAVKYIHCCVLTFGFMLQKRTPFCLFLLVTNITFLILFPNFIAKYNTCYLSSFVCGAFEEVARNAKSKKKAKKKISEHEIERKLEREIFKFCKAVLLTYALYISLKRNCFVVYRNMQFCMHSFVY